MLKSDFFQVLTWWVYLLALGVVFFPLARMWFSRFYDEGYFLAKALGILISSYTVWLLSSLHIAPFTRLTVGVVLALSAWVLWGWGKGLKPMQEVWARHRKLLIFEELAFLVLLAIWSYVRGHNPAIFGLEKFLDFGFVNAILRAPYMPAMDHWFAGSPINYYYFGQFICAYLIRLSGIAPEIGYNLMIATLFAQCATMAFSVTSNLVYLVTKTRNAAVWVSGVASGLLCSLGGNLHTFIYAVLLPWLYDNGLYDGVVKSYWYPDATRFIGYNPPVADKTIHEFPHYSFVVSDLHAHVSDIPVVLALLAAVYVFYQTPVPTTGLRWLAPTRWVCLIAFLLAITLMTNTWDYPIYMLLAGGAVALKAAVTEPTWKRRLLNIGIHAAQLIGLSALMVLPFTLQFQNFAKGIDWVHAHTPFYQLLVLWGYQVVMYLSLIFALILLFNRLSQPSEEAAPAEKFWPRLKTFWQQRPAEEQFIVLAGAVGILLLAVPEVIYVKDIYTGDHHRANTMFKFTYQAFIIFTITAGYALVMAQALLKQIQWPYRWVIVGLQGVLVTLPLLYPFWAVKSNYGELTLERYKGLDGLQFLAKDAPGDYQAVRWLNTHVNGQPVLLEANGDSFTIANRVTAQTGLPTILGWFVHQWLYRGDAKIPQGRVPEVAAVYEATDLITARRVLEKYNVRYILVGVQERTKFKKLNEAKLKQMGPVVFESGGTYIIEVQPAAG